MRKIKIAILGSTGSIGKQTISLIKNDSRFKVVFLSARNNSTLLKMQAKKLGVEQTLSLSDVRNSSVKANEKNDSKNSSVKKIEKNTFSKRKNDNGADYFSSLNDDEVLNNELCKVIKTLDFDILINALVGISGLAPTYEAIKRGKLIALANKETLVTGGDIIMSEAKKRGVVIAPIDSEHSAIFQCLKGNENEQIKKIILTASGGPFRDFTLQKLKSVTKKDALNHPNWSMGAKITIDSATLMNKGFEVIEAYHLFNVPKKNIEVVIHKESIIHSLVEFADNAVLAQLGSPSMLVPISYAINYLASFMESAKNHFSQNSSGLNKKFPLRKQNPSQSIDLSKIGSFTFSKPDLKTFKCLDFAFTSLSKKNSYAVALNASNEILVSLFLKEKINFLSIQKTIEKVLKGVEQKNLKTVKEIMDFDKEIKIKTFGVF